MRSSRFVAEVTFKEKLTIDEKHAQFLKYLQQLIAENYEPNTDIEIDETETESDVTDQQTEKEENDIDAKSFSLTMKRTTEKNSLCLFIYI